MNNDPADDSGSLAQGRIAIVHTIDRKLLCKRFLTQASAGRKKQWDLQDDFNKLRGKPTQLGQPKAGENLECRQT